MTDASIFLACVDLETFLIKDGGGAPPLVCAGWTVFDDDSVQRGLVTVKGESEGVFQGTPDKLVRWLFSKIGRAHV